MLKALDSFQQYFREALIGLRALLDREEVVPMKMNMDISTLNQGLDILKDQYRIMAPVKMPFRGTLSDTSQIRYQEISRFEEIEFEEKAQFSAKEIFQPITQILFYFTEEAYQVPAAEQKKVLVFLRACDMHAVQRTDAIYLNNGPVDPYYKQIRDRVEFALIGCTHSFRNCFCVSMGTNQAADYAIGVKPSGNRVQLDVKSDALESVLNTLPHEQDTFEMDYVTENEMQVKVPENLNAKAIASHDLFREYDSRCVACGKCNFVCPTCTCFAMQDIFYKDNENAGERRRVWSSCHVDGYTDMAGGHAFRKKHGDRMRFKKLHKVHDYEKRFGKHMCVGCGRCDDACPQYISFSSCVNKLSKLEKEES
jgi:anaerobic sulfite reductase subunit A